MDRGHTRTHSSSVKLDEMIVIDFEFVHSIVRIKSQMGSVWRWDQDRRPEELRACLQASIPSL